MGKFPPVLTQLTAPGGVTTSWTYDKTGRTLSETTAVAGGATVATNFTWGVSGQAGDTSTAKLFLRTVAQTVNGVAFWSYTRTNTPIGQLIGQSGSRALYQGNAAASESFTFGYDGRGRLTTSNLTYKGTATNQTFGYDLANNLNSNDSGVGGTWSYNTASQLATAASTSGGMGFSGNPAIAYDGIGNVNFASGMSLTWDKTGLLASVSNTPVGTVSYRYDLMGRRAARLVGGTLTNRYLYDQSLLIAETDAAGTITRSYNWGATGLISDSDVNGIRLYLYDGQGTVRALVSSTGALLWEGMYSPWGIARTTAAPTAFAWNGRFGGYTDSATGLVQLGVRDYSPKMGRWIARDPSGFLGGANLYAYCMGDPLNYSDPNGQNPLLIVGGGALIGGGMAWWDGYHKGLRGKALAIYVGKGVLKGGLTAAAIMLLGPGAGACTSLGSAIAFGAGTGAIGSVVSQGVDMAFGDKDRFSLKELARDTLMGAAMGGLGKLAGALCFPGDTPVQMADVQDGSSVSSKKQRSSLVRHTGASAARSGQSSAKSARASSRVKPISQIRVGDLVASRDEATGKLVTGKVTATSKRVAFELYEVSLADAATGQVVERIRATREHPFYVVGKGWIAARYLGVGNSLVTRAGPAGSGLIVSGLKRSFHPQGIPVYNFGVDYSHSYFVGNVQKGLWAHNSGGNNCWEEIHGHHLYPKEFADRFRRIFGDGFDVDNHTVPLPRPVHLDGVHGGPKASDGFFNWSNTGNGGWWNKTWRDWLDANPNATAQEAEEQMREMSRMWGIHTIPQRRYRANN